MKRRLRRLHLIRLLRRHLPLEGKAMLKFVLIMCKTRDFRARKVQAEQMLGAFVSIATPRERKTSSRP